MVTNATARARREALEEAARIAEDLPGVGENPHAWPTRIAAAIRAKIREGQGNG